MSTRVGPRRIILTTIASIAMLVPSHAVLAAPCWRPPVSGQITDPFREPPCPYCAGNRGIDYAVGENAQVRAVDDGVVTWAGTIAGVRYVVVRHANGWRVTYGQLDATTLQRDDPVAKQSLIGTASGSFYFGLRVGEEYRDPAPYFGRLVGRPRLVPIDGTDQRPAPPPLWRCPTAS